MREAKDNAIEDLADTIRALRARLAEVERDREEWRRMYETAADERAEARDMADDAKRGLVETDHKLTTANARADRAEGLVGLASYFVLGAWEVWQGRYFADGSGSVRWRIGKQGEPCCGELDTQAEALAALEKAVGEEAWNAATKSARKEQSDE